MISFIIPAWNEAPIIGATIESIHAAARALNESYEIVVADDGSTDDTAATAERQGARVVRVAHRQIAATRNSGARASTGNFLIFVDADTLVNEAVVRGAIASMRSGAAGGGSAVKLDDGVPWHAPLVTRLLVLGFRVAGLASGCFLFATRSAFDAVGGFDERYFGAEEIVMSRALKRQGRFVVLREAVVTSGRKLRTHSTSEFWRLMIRAGSRGPKGVQQRERMELWYGPRRDDPGR